MIQGLLSVREAAKRLGVLGATVYEAARHGRMYPANRNPFLFTITEVERYGAVRAARRSRRRKKKTSESGGG